MQSDRHKLADLNKKIYNANMALSKWNQGERAEQMRAELDALYAEKAKLPADLLHQEKVDNVTRRLKSAVGRVHKFPDIAINREDVKQYAELMLELGIPQVEIDAIIGDALDPKEETNPALATADAQELLGDLTQHVKAYLDDLSFKAELDPSYTVPIDLVADIQA